LGTLTIDRTSVSGNQDTGNQADGGGIYNSSGTVIVTNSTIDHNSSAGTAGGLYNTSDSTMQLTNVTISANTAGTEGGGIYNEEAFSSDYSVITMTNVTMKDNKSGDSGGLWNGNSTHNLVYLKNTILADNHPCNCLGRAITSAKYSLSSDTSCTLSGTGNLTNTPAKLFPLLTNGGTTRTYLPASDSPALNSVGGADYPGTDQRGLPRPQGIGADMGAVERQPSDKLQAPWLYLPLISR
jgi:predicted outer membrane repeat protein